MKLKLSDADRERLGCPEWLELDLGTFTVAEAVAAEKAGGDWTKIASPGAAATAMRIWLSLRRVGVEVPDLDKLDVNLMGMEVEDDEREPGKAASGPDGSPTPQTFVSSIPGSTPPA